MIHFSRILLIILAVLGFSKISNSQSSILTEGIIRFQKRVNNHAQMKLMFDSQTPEGQKLIDNFTGMTDQFETFNFSLEYFDNKTFYKPEGYFESRNILSEITSRNSVYSDFDQKKTQSSVAIFDKKLIIEDDVRPIKWKLTDESRNIAGYECKRANGLIADSIYVVAFYTEEIATMGGPEQFNGLPGMILGVALPHDHVSWFATKIEKNTSPTSLTRELNGDKISKSKVSDFIKDLVAPKIKINEKIFDRIIY